MSNGRFRRIVPPTERRLSWTLLALLPLVAAAVYLKGQQVDPRLFALDPALLEQPADPPAGAIARPRPDISLPIELALPGWTVDGGVETFTADTLYRKIDGRAEEYLKYGCRRLQFVSYASGSRFVDLYLYELATSSQAAAVFAAERPPRASRLRIGQEGYCVDASCFFYAGPYYAQIVGSEAGAELDEAAKTIAHGLDAAIARADASLAASPPARPARGPE
jgi:hypothetical protein